MENLDGWRKNLSRITEQFPAFTAECREQTKKVKDALSRRDLPDALHHASGYLEAALQHLHKLWFYLWIPKWLAVAILFYNWHLTRTINDGLELL